MTLVSHSLLPLSSEAVVVNVFYILITTRQIFEIFVIFLQLCLQSEKKFFLTILFTVQQRGIWQTKLLAKPSNIND